MSAEGSRRAIFAALAANAGIAAAKFVGFLVTNSSSMLAEAVHSVADTSNQGLLLIGQRRSEHAPDAVHQFGYGRARYFYAFVVALVISTLGSLFAIVEGIDKLRNPHELSNPLVAVIILVVAIGLESYSFATARRESKPLKGDAGWWRFIRTSRSPELPIVLLEDSGALVGLVFALAGVGLSLATGDPIWDAVGTLGIGVLLGVIAVVLIIEMQSLLIGEGLTESDQQAILNALTDGERIERVIHLRTQYLGPEDVLVAAKIAIAPGTTAEGITAAIDGAEARVRAQVPIATLIYLEPDLDHGTGTDAAPVPSAGGGS